MDEWAKIKHVETGRDLLPSQLDQFIASHRTLPQSIFESKLTVDEPSSISGFLSVHKANP